MQPKSYHFPQWMPLPHFSPDSHLPRIVAAIARHTPSMKRVLASALLVVLVLSAGPAAADPPRWAWPTPAPHALVRQYLAPATPYGPGHRGIDIATDSVEVTAPADGVVHFAGVVVDRPVLSVRHLGGLLSSFEPVSTVLVEGDAVERGQVVGTLERGHCPQQLCLHFGVRLDGEYVNPLLLLGGVPRSVLLPTRAPEL